MPFTCILICEKMVEKPWCTFMITHYCTPSYNPTLTFIKTLHCSTREHGLSLCRLVARKSGAMAQASKGKVLDGVKYSHTILRAQCTNMDTRCWSGETEWANWWKGEVVGWLIGPKKWFKHDTFTVTMGCDSAGQAKNVKPLRNIPCQELTRRSGKTREEKRKRRKIQKLIFLSYY